MKHPRPRGSVKVILIIAAALAISAVSILAFHFTRPGVTVTHVVEGPVVQAFYATGTVRPRLEYPISSSVAGLVTQVLVTQGQSVKKGDSLAIVSDPNLQAEAD